MYFQKKKKIVDSQELLKKENKKSSGGYFFFTVFLNAKNFQALRAGDARCLTVIKLDGTRKFGLENELKQGEYYYKCKKEKRKSDFNWVGQILF